MPREQLSIVAFNRGLVSRLALARGDLKRLALSAATMVNWMPRALGSMMLRPGLQYILSTASNAAARYVEFIRANNDTALLEFTNLAMRVVISDAVITRLAVSTAVANGTFNADLTSWTDNDEAGGTSVWVAGGYMGLTGDGTAAAIRDQSVSVAVPDRNVEHALRVVIQRGPVTIRVGTGTTDDSYVTETDLDTGAHSLAFTPTGNFNIRFLSRLERQVLVDSCDVEAAGVMSLPTPWATADLDNIRAGPDSQSADILFVACSGNQQRKIERRTTRSWSVVRYQADNGPFRLGNFGPITITPSALTGNITLTASAPLFRSTQGPSTNNDGALFRVTSQGQQVTQSISAENTFTNAIRITGVDASRAFTIVRSGVWNATITLQRSLDSDTGPWEDVTTYITNATITFDDGLDNQIAWYRIGVKTGGYTSGTAVVTLTYALGAIDGIARITGFTNSTTVTAEVLQDMGGTAATDVWAEGEWSDRRGWPSSGTFYEGRLGWAGLDKAWLSVSDAFTSFDDTTEGDSGPISRSIGSGPLETLNWMLPLQRLILGGQGAEHSCRSNAFDEPLTPTNFNIKPASSQGSAAVQARTVDSKGVYIQRGGTRLMELAFAPDIYDYQSVDLSLLIPEIGKPNVVRIAVQRQPDTRIHCVRSDGTVAALVYDRGENVICWCEIETDGLIEDVVVLPGVVGEDEDKVYYVVNRTINAATVRYLEKWALESQCAGSTVNRQADAFVTFTNGPASATVSGLTHLIGETVVIWYDGKCPEDANGNIKTFVVSGGGTITLDETATTGIVGLAYTADFLSAKLGTALTAHKRVDHIGLVLADTHAKGLRFGPELDDTRMDYLPLMFEGAPVTTNQVYSEFDQEPIPFPGTWTTDARLALRAAAPRPCTVMAAIVEGEVYA